MPQPLRAAVVLTALVTALVCFLVIGSLAPRAARAAADPERLELAGGDAGFWWVHAGEQSAATVAFGPPLVTPEGVGRGWALSVSLPGTPEMLTCVQGTLDLDDAAPIAAQGELFRVELRPRAPLVWADVAGPEQLDARVDGLH